MKLVVRHATQYHYGSGTSQAAMLLKLMPRNFDGHRVVEWSVEVNGERVTDFRPNGYGDLEALWQGRGWMEEAEIVAAGIVETEERAGVVRGLPERFHPGIYLRQTALTRPGSDFERLLTGLSQDSELDRLHALSARIREAMDYRAGATNPSTTAAEALAMGCGVCQDHAHVFIAAARLMGVPIRYVTGYLLAAEDDMAVHETHAWAEAHVAGLGWVGFDVSNQVSTTEAYVRIAGGMDAHDAAPIRGSAVVSGTISVDADVRIAPAEEGTQIQQLQEQQQQ